MAQVKTGSVYVCADKDGCGIEVEVKKVCGCIDECDLVCCGKPMQLKTKAASCGCCSR